MKRGSFIVILLLFTLSSFAQINMADSTVKVIGYWDKNEKQSYAVVEDSYKVKGVDTVSRQKIKYDVDITIVDSTEKSYTIEWYYRNFSMDTKNEFVKKVMSIAQDMKVIIKTDELGTFEEVVNWVEVQNYIKSAMEKLGKEFPQLPGFGELIAQMGLAYSSKEAIETTSINDIQQFYNFHGAQYKLGEELTAQTKAPNILGGEPFDCSITAYLDEVNEADNNYILRSSHEVNKEQLTEATYKFVVETSQKMGIKPPARDELKDLKNDVQTASRIHGSGWPIYSVQTKTVTDGSNTSIKERVIEIK